MPQTLDLSRLPDPPKTGGLDLSRLPDQVAPPALDLSRLPDQVTSTGIVIRDQGRPTVDPVPWLTRAAPTALRVGGGIAGGVIGSMAAGVGAVPGGIAGGVLGEAAAEALEIKLGHRKDYNLPQIATQGVVNAIPFGTAAKGVSTAGRVMRGMSQGAATAGVADVATNLAEGRGWQVPNPAALGLGIVLGGGAGAAASRVPALRAAADPTPGSALAEFPDGLYHGTTDDAASSIMQSGRFDTPPILAHHATRVEHVPSILSGGLRADTVNRGLGKEWGDGVYLADQQSDAGSFWRNELETANETDRAASAMLSVEARPRNPVTIDGLDYSGRALPDKELVYAVTRAMPEQVDRYKQLVAEGVRPKVAVNRVAREAGYDALIVDRITSKEIVAFDPSTLRVVGVDGKPVSAPGAVTLDTPAPVDDLVLRTPRPSASPAPERLARVVNQDGLPPTSPIPEHRRVTEQMVALKADAGPNPVPTPDVPAVRAQMGAVIDAQNALPPTPSMWERITASVRNARNNWITTAAKIDDFMREGGLDPLTMFADAGNPSKSYDLAKGGWAGPVEDMTNELNDLLKSAGVDGIERPLQELLNLNHMEAGAARLARKAADEASEATLAARARAVGRQPRQLQLVPRAPEPLDDLGRVAAATDALRRADPAPPEVGVTPKTATATAPSSAPMHSTSLAPETPRTDAFKVVPREAPVPEARGVRGKPLTPEQLAEIQRQRLARTSAGLADDADAADDLAQPSLFDDVDDAVPAAGPTEYEIPTQSPLPKFKRGPQPTQPMDENILLMTQAETDAINEAVDAAKLAEVKTRTTTQRVHPPMSSDDIARVAADLDVAVEHVAAFAKAADRKGGLPEWLIRSEIAAAKRRGGWQQTIDTTGTSKNPGIGRKLAEGTALPGGFTPPRLAEFRKDWQARTDITPQQKAAVEQIASRVFLMRQRVLETAIESGLISRETGDNLLESAFESARTGTGGYGPLTRIMDDLVEALRLGGANVDVTTQHVLQNIKGSARTNVHPLVAGLRQAAVTFHEAARNNAVKDLVALRNKGGYFAETIIPLKGDTKPPAGWGEVSVFENGARTRYALPEGVASAYKTKAPPPPSLAGSALQLASHVFRTGTTMANFGYSVPNVLRDVSSVAVATGRSPVLGLLNPALWKDYGESLAQVVRNSPEARAYLRSNAAFSGFQRSLDGPALRIKALERPDAVQTVGRVFASPLTFAKWVNKNLEDAGKLTAFKEFSKQLPDQPREAAWQTRRYGGSPDYGRKGDLMATANTWFPFLNAAVQSVARIPAFARQYPGRAAAAVAGVTLKLAALQALNNSWTDPDGTKSWDRVPQREKEQNWILFIPGTFKDPETGVERQSYIKIPVSYDLNLFRAPIQAALDDASRNPIDIANALGGNLPMSPNIDPARPFFGAGDTLAAAANPLLRVPAEEMMNREAFRGVPIESPRLQQREPQERFTERTSPAMVALGQATGRSPAMLEHRLRGFAGGVGQAALDMIDPLFGDRIQKPVTETPVLKQLTEAPILSGITRPIVRRFMGGPSSIDAVNNKKKERFYKVLNEAQQARATFNGLRSDAQTGSSPAFRAAAQQRLEAWTKNPRNVRLYGMASRLNTISQAIANARKIENYDAEMQMLNAVDAALAEMDDQ